MVRFLGWDQHGVPVRELSRESNEDAPPRGNEDPVSLRQRNRLDYDLVVGLMLGLAAKLRVDKLEANQLMEWGLKFAISPYEWPAGIIAGRLGRIYQSGGITDEEVEDLILLLEDMAGNPNVAPSSIAKIPFTDPVPQIEFANKVFLFTGRFVHGINACLEDLWPRGGRYVQSLSPATDYIVVGAIRSQEWRSNCSGLITQTAGPIMNSGKGAAIISEQSYLRAVSQWRLS